ncbi:hypothetical protein B0H13DRAFT_2683541 [Mycena leptocephala]|nr:hypothetical protein B0H13DRAFT_2683541 [Mycena leptocephala]
MSIETSATSFIDTSDAGHRNISGASSSIAQYLTLSERMKIAKSTTVITQNTRAWEPNQNKYLQSLWGNGPIEAKGPVRVVGRGGQGSRPRLVGPEGTALTTPQPLRSPTYEMGAPARLDNTRIVGRGGMGSRPRDLPAPAPVVVPLPKQTQAPAQWWCIALVVRDKGKGKSPPFAWKGKGKETGNASTYGAPSLTRTDTLDSMGNGSVIQFLPVRGPQRIYQSTVGQDPIPEVPFEGGSGASVDIGARRTGRLHKLLRPRRTETPSSHSTGTRASSVSGLSIGSDAADSMSLDNTSGRRTNYESTPPIPVFQYPKPPAPHRHFLPTWNQNSKMTPNPKFCRVIMTPIPTITRSRAMPPPSVPLLFISSPRWSPMRMAIMILIGTGHGHQRL